MGFGIDGVRDVTGDTRSIFKLLDMGSYNVHAVKTRLRFDPPRTLRLWIADRVLYKLSAGTRVNSRGDLTGLGDEERVKSSLAVHQKPT